MTIDKVRRLAAQAGAEWKYTYGEDYPDIEFTESRLFAFAKAVEAETRAELQPYLVVLKDGRDQ